MDLETRIKQLPAFTKWYMGAVLLMTACVSFNIISPKLIIFHYSFILKLEFWRLFTCFLFFGPFNFQIVFTLLMIYFGVGNTEKIYLDQQKKYYSDFYYLAFFCMLACLLIGLLFQIPILGQSLIMAFLYIWCKKRPLEKVSFFFGIIVDSGYLPWVLIVWNVITGNSVFNDLIGIGIGHLYIVLKDILPQNSFIFVIFNFVQKCQNRKRFIDKQFSITDASRNQNQQQQGAGGAFGGYRAFQGQGHRIN